MPAHTAAPMLRRLALLALFGALAACDSAADLEPVAGVVLVSVGEAPNDGPGLLLRTEAAYPCGSRLVVSEESGEARLSVAVEGVAAADGPPCLAPDAPLAYATFLPAAEPTAEVEVRHRGAADLYRYTCGFVGCALEAVRTSTTRLGTP